MVKGEPGSGVAPTIGRKDLGGEVGVLVGAAVDVFRDGAVVPEMVVVGALVVAPLEGDGAVVVFAVALPLLLDEAVGDTVPIADAVVGDGVIAWSAVDGAMVAIGVHSG